VAYRRGPDRVLFTIALRRVRGEAEVAQVSRSMKFVRKAEAALMAAIEIYNKPDFQYREETFAILTLNAWELLLKGKLLEERGNDLRCLYVYDTHQTKRGQQSKKLYLKKNRAGNVHTIGLGRVIVALENKTPARLPPAVKMNIDGLTEIRDNAIHYVNASPQLAKQVLEIGTASVRNFIELARAWFRLDLSTRNLFLMPIGFVGGPQATALAVSPDEKNLVRYLAGLVRDAEADGDSGFHVSLSVNLSFTRSSKEVATVVAVTDDPAAPVVQLREEDIRAAYPWDYAELIRRVKKRYIDFKANRKYLDVLRPLKQDSRYVKSRFLDPGNPKSSKKDFYNPNILREFDRHYTRNT
jgi:hypothetical protein